MATIGGSGGQFVDHFDGAGLVVATRGAITKAAAADRTPGFANFQAPANTSAIKSTDLPYSTIGQGNLPGVGGLIDTIA